MIAEIVFYILNREGSENHSWNISVDIIEIGYSVNPDVTFRIMTGYNYATPLPHDVVLIIRRMRPKFAGYTKEFLVRLAPSL